MVITNETDNVTTTDTVTTTAAISDGNGNKMNKKLSVNYSIINDSDDLNNI